jgi:serine/threonine protein phosphatase PrpC
LSLYSTSIVPPQFKLTHFGVTDTGRVRTRNEDSFICVPEQNLWVVADGMGGHDSGDFASITITEQASKFIQQASLEDSILVLEENFLHSNELIHHKAEKLGKNITIGSTVASLFVWDDLAFVLWAGDSRVYRFRDNELMRLSEDHSYVEELVRLGKLSEAEADAHPAANVVLNAIGIDTNITIDMEYSHIQDEDLFILCSDGLFKDLPEQDISRILSNQNASVEQTTQALLAAALDAGGSDNCTIIVVKASIEKDDV